MHVIYLDVLFAINLMINYVLLLLTGEFSGIYVSRLRIFLGAGTGAFFSVLVFFCDFSGMLAICIKLLFCVAVTVIAFGKEARGHLKKLCTVFCVINFALAGVVVAISYFGGETGLLAVKNGVPYINISIKLLLLSTAVVYGILTLIFGGGAIKINKQTSKIQAKIGNGCVTVKALSDSGNMLRDPLSGRYIIVIGKKAALPLFTGAATSIIEGLSEQNVISAYEQLCKNEGYRFGVVPYKTSSTKSALLLTVKADSITVNDNLSIKHLIGISPVEIDVADGCRGIIGV